MCYKVVIVIIHRNSHKFIEIAKMSLYSAFLVAQSTNYAKTVVVLLDDASDDGSFGELQNFGEKISKELGIDFFAYRSSSPKGHPYLLHYAYTLACQRFQADYLLKLDHDCIITNFKILDELIRIIAILKMAKINLFSIAPAILTCPRKYYNKYGANLSQIMRDKKCFIGGINKASRNGAIFRIDFDRSSYKNIEKIHPTLFTYSTAFIINIKDIKEHVKNPFFPFMIRAYFEDVFSGIIMARKGFHSFLYMKLGGIHYTGTHSKISKDAVFFFFYNLALLRSLLYGMMGVLTMLVTALLSSLVLRLTLLNKIILSFEKLKIIQLSSIEKHILEVNEDLRRSLSKDIVVAAIYGSINSRKYMNYIKTVYKVNYSRLKNRTNLEKYLPCFPVRNLKDILCNVISLFHII